MEPTHMGRQRMAEQQAEERRVRQIWDRDAPKYDNWMHYYDKYMVRDGRRWVCSRAIGRTLEIAVGTGLDLAHYNPGVLLTAMDLSTEMLARARARATAAGLDVAFTSGSAHNLPFADHSFDSVVCVLALCCIPDDRSAIGEMLRVLRPGGRLLLLDHVASTSASIRLAQRLIEPLTVRFAGDHQTRRSLPRALAAGFTIETSHRSRAGMIERVHAIAPSSTSC